MWDQLGLNILGQPYHRIIPTYVGSTLWDPRTQRQASNHSHVCGINAPVWLSVNAAGESFPRMWDQRKLDYKPEARGRIIPTYVGSTSLTSPVITLPSNHSHVCGINASPTSSPTAICESFPRMWDQRCPRRCDRRPERIIPTYVGSTHSSVRSMLRRPNHSHVCGINLADLGM